MTDYGPPCPPCKYDPCYCSDASELEQRCASQTGESRRRGSQIQMGEPPLSSQIRTQVRAVDCPLVLRREVSCIQGWPKVAAWITEAYTNVHGSGAVGKCERGHRHLFTLTEKEYKAVDKALRQPRLL